MSSKKPVFDTVPFEHGGCISAAAARWNIPEKEWLDLSTGINPDPWPVPEIPSSLWQRLPHNDAALLNAAQSYYQTTSILPIPGSQAAIQWLPWLKKSLSNTLANVLLPAIGYSEHRKNWEQADHNIFTFDNLSASNSTQQILSMIDKHNIDVLVVMNPNNPLGTRMEERDLLRCYKHLQARKGWLIVDEAFNDIQDRSMIPRCPKPGLLVLRSMGKFFGLAGARLGFACGDTEVLDLLRERIGPWSISHPAQYLATLALQDSVWQQTTRKNLSQNSENFSQLLQKQIPAHIVKQVFNNDFFISLLTEKAIAENYYQQLATQGVLTRYLPVDEKTSLLRFGLLRFNNHIDEQRLIAALNHAESMHSTQ